MSNETEQFAESLGNGFTFHGHDKAGNAIASHNGRKNTYPTKHLTYDRKAPLTDVVKGKLLGAMFHWHRKTTNNRFDKKDPDQAEERDVRFSESTYSPWVEDQKNNPQPDFQYSEEQLIPVSAVTNGDVVGMPTITAPIQYREEYTIPPSQFNTPTQYVNDQQFGEKGIHNKEKRKELTKGLFGDFAAHTTTTPEHIRNTLHNAITKLESGKGFENKEHYHKVLEKVKGVVEEAKSGKDISHHFN